ncbi:MAG: HEAT repeat domain-containing protein, partial [Cyanobacteria bacterium P01_E01_bin.43]
MAIVASLRLPMLESLASLHHSCAYEQDDTPELNLEPIASGIGISLAVLASFANLQSIQAIPVLQQGDQEESVRDLKQRLQTAGCLPPRLAWSDQYDEYTVAAVKSLQRQKSLAMTDSFDGPVVGLVEAGENCNAAEDAGALKPDDESPDVAMLRQQLKNWGFPLAGQELLAVTNDFDSDTEAALKEFEEFFGLKEDGILDVLDSKILWTARNVELQKLFEDLTVTESNAIDRITKFLQSDSEVDRRVAVNALEKMGFAGEKALPAIIALLKSPNQAERKFVASTLGRMDAEEALPQLLAMLDSDPSVRNDAAQAIGQIGGTEIAQDLISRLESPNVEVRTSAVTALAWIGADAKDAVPALIKTLKSPNIDEREAAANALGSIGTEAKAAISELVSLLDSESANVSGAAALAIGRIGGIEAVPDLIARLNSEDFYVRIQAATALGEIGAEAKAAVLPLIELLQSPSGDDRKAAVTALGNIGVDAKAAVPELVLLLDTNSYVRDNAAIAIGQIGGTEAVLDLISLLKAPDVEIRMAAAKALGGLGADAREATPELVALLASEKEPESRSEVIRVISQVGGTEAVPALIELLKSPNAQERHHVAIALGKIDPPAEAAVPALIPLLKDTHSVEALNQNTVQVSAA